MSLRPMLDDWNIPGIQSIQSQEKRHFVELEIPGKAGNLFQDMHVDPLVVAIVGSVFGGETGEEFLRSLREKFHAGEPLTFVADIVQATDVQYVVIDSLHISENAAYPDQWDYALVIKESPPPPPPADILGDLDTGLLDDAAGFMDSVTGALDLLDGVGSIPDIGDPTPQVRAAMDQVSSATEGLQTAASLLDGLFGGGE
jgi:hypothetical protein